MYIRKLIKKQTTILVATFLVLTIAVLSSTYALFQRTFVGEEQSISVGNLVIAFNNGSDTELTDNDKINITNVSPMSDDSALSANNNTYTFVVKNTGTVAYEYTIKLLDNDDYQSSILLDHDYIRYQLKLNNMAISAPAFLGDQTNNLIFNYTINPNETHSYTLKTWVADPDTYSMPDSVLEKEVHLSILIEGEAGDKAEPKGWSDAQSGTLMYAIKNSYNVTNTVTIPGVNISTSNEAVLARTPDDYGTSFYFRGNVTNNYVLFAEKCWRIVRITGDGSIKLFLWNNANTCTSSSNAYDDIAFNSTTQLDENSNTVYNYATGVGFMYGHSIPTGSTDNEKYLDAQANITDSYILNKLKTWYTATFNTQALQNKLADTIWCGDKSLTGGVGYGQTQSYFGARERLSVTKKPSLICPDAGSDGKLSKFTSSDTNKGNGALNGYKIGMLTADEVAFAGGVYNVANNNYYLRTGSDYWTLSPYFFYASDSNAYVWRVYGAGILSSYRVTNGYGVRPAVSLISAAQLSDTVGQDGTVDHPYEIA